MLKERRPARDLGGNGISAADGDDENESNPFAGNGCFEEMFLSSAIAELELEISVTSIAEVKFSVSVKSVTLEYDVKSIAEFPFKDELLISSDNIAVVIGEADDDSDSLAEPNDSSRDR